MNEKLIGLIVLLLGIKISSVSPKISSTEKLTLLSTASSLSPSSSSSLSTLSLSTKSQISPLVPTPKSYKPNDAYGSEALQRYRRNLQLIYETTQSTHCESFVSGVEGKNMLTSPGYRDKYPNNTDCVVVLRAPAGHLVQLDFRDKFDIEEADDCKYDYLEVRDGAHGYSKLLGKFCGKAFPPMLTSSDRNMWIHFSSDDNIEYYGFSAKYSYIARPTQTTPESEVCQVNVTGNEGWINRSHVPDNFVQTSIEQKTPIDCMWVVQVREGWKMHLLFPHFELARPNDCDMNFVDIFPEKTDIPSRLKNFCGSIADSVNSSSNILHIRFYVRPPALNSTFAILFTAYRDKLEGKTCDEDDEYDCEDSTCIAKELRCNGRVNCRFRWDEDECDKEIAGQSEHVIIIIVVFGLILGGMITAFMVNCFRKLIRDHKIIREHIRQSKESKLDELGRHSTKMSRENLANIKIPQHTKKKDLSNSGIGMDDVSHHRYFRDTVPISTIPGNTRIDIKRDTVSRGHEMTDIPESMQSDEDDDLKAGMCDMACQTRESLFQPVFKNKVSQSPPQQPRFSTFGYDTAQQQQQTQPTSGKSISKTPSKSSKKTIATTIEMEDFGIGPPPPIHQSHSIPSQDEPAPQKHQHHSHQHHAHHHHAHYNPNYPMEPISTTTKKPIKHQESRLVLDIRNSAPDVIIMTSSH